MAGVATFADYFGIKNCCRMKFFPLSLLALSLFFACKNQPKTATEAEQITQTTVQVPQDFLDFYEKFHRDSLYQMEHIIWPLRGDMSEQVDSTHYQKKSAEWQQDKWRMQRTDYDPKDYILERSMLGDVMVIERIRAKSANYGLERRFAKQPDGGWALIYYSDLQEVGR